MMCKPSHLNMDHGTSGSDQALGFVRDELSRMADSLSAVVRLAEGIASELNVRSPRSTDAVDPVDGIVAPRPRATKDQAS